jgi:hypothetical protein
MVHPFSSIKFLTIPNATMILRFTTRNANQENIRPFRKTNLINSNTIGVDDLFCLRFLTENKYLEECSLI